MAGNHFECVKYRWQLYCETESKTLLVVNSSNTGPSAPTECPHGSGHTITTESVKRVWTTMPDSITTNENEEDGDERYCGGRYFATAINCDVTNANAGSTMTFLAPADPVNRCVLNTQFDTEAQHKGDNIIAFVKPNPMPVLPITGAVSAGATTIPTLKTVMANLEVGYFVWLTENGVSDSLGRLTTLDWDNSQIEVQTATTNSFTASALIEFRVHFADITFSHPRPFLLAAWKEGGSRVGKSGVDIGVEYNNLSGGKKELYFFLEYTY